jgi:hypothetical protein
VFAATRASDSPEKSVAARIVLSWAFVGAADAAGVRRFPSGPFDDFNFIVFLSCDGYGLIPFAVLRFWR